MRFLVLAPLALLLAGCAAPAATLEPASAPLPPPLEPAAPLEPLTFGAPVDTDRLTRGAEPSIAVAPDGTIYVSAPSFPLDVAGLAAGNPQSQVWVSRDGGQSFTRLGEGPWGRKAEYSGGGDSDVAVDATGRVYMADLGAGVPVLASVDGGATWNLTEDATGNGQADRQWILAGEPAEAFLFYTTYSPNSVTYLTMTRTTDGGASWAPPKAITPVALFESIHGAPTLDQERRTLYVPFTVPHGMRMAVSRDGGESFATHVVADSLPSRPATIFPTSAVDRAGNVYVAWSAPTAWGNQLYYAWSPPGGESWSIPIRASYGVGNFIMPWIVAGDEGRVAIVHYATTPLPWGATTPDKSHAALWNVKVAHTLNATSPNPEFVDTLAVRRVHVGSVCTDGAACMLGAAFGKTDPPADRTLGDFLEAALLPDGRLAIAYAHDDPAPLAMAPTAAVVLQTGGDLLVQGE